MSSAADVFKAAGLRQRVITAVIIAVLFLAIVFWTSLFWFQVFFTIVFLTAAWEWADMASFSRYRERLIYVSLIGCAAAWLQFVTHITFYPAALLQQPESIDLDNVESLMMLALGFWMIALCCILKYPASEKLWSGRMTRAAIGFFVILPTWSGIVLLKQQEMNGMLVLCIVWVVALADIGAYFAGVRFGKHKLAPRVSPGKSWEGVLGGMVCNLIFAMLLAGHLNLSVGETLLLVVVLVITTAASIVGDLFESMIKRCRGVKDSGSLLPGHGGVLDRIDGWMAAVPVFTLAYLSSAAWN